MTFLPYMLECTHIMILYKECHITTYKVGDVLLSRFNQGFSFMAAILGFICGPERVFALRKDVQLFFMCKNVLVAAVCWLTQQQCSSQPVRGRFDFYSHKPLLPTMEGILQSGKQHHQLNVRA